MPLRAKRFLVSFFYHSCVVTIYLIGFFSGVATRNIDSQLLFFGLLLLHILTLRLNPLGRLIQQALITRTGCPGCQRSIELVD